MDRIDFPYRPASLSTRLSLGAVFLLLAAGAARADVYKVEPARTEIAFEIGAKGYPLTHGVFHGFSSTLAIDFDHPQRSAVNFTVSAASLDTKVPALDAYVESPAFLDAGRFPDISFASTAVRRVSDHSVEVTGNLTLLGVTRPQTFQVNVTRDPDMSVALQAEGAIHRSDFGMTAGLPLISDDVRIIVATRAAAQ